MPHPLPKQRPEDPLPVPPLCARQFLCPLLAQPEHTGCLPQAVLQARLQSVPAGDRYGVRRLASECLLDRLPGQWQERCLPMATLRLHNKGFACEWIGRWHVLVGTKSNELVCVDVRTLATARVPLGELPPRPQTTQDTLPYVNEQRNCGQHALAFNPRTQLLAAGGAHPADCQVFTVLRGPGGQPSFRPARTLVGHDDWVFSMAWMTDVHMISGSRDGTLRLWQVNQAPWWGSPSVAGPLTAVVASPEHKVREVRYSEEARCVYALTSDGTLQLWDPHLHLQRQVGLGVRKEVVGLAAQHHLVAAGSIDRVSLLDARVPARLCELRSDDGVRSLELQGHLLSVGSRCGSLGFLDLRAGRFLTPPGAPPVPPGALAAGAGVGPGTARRVRPGWVEDCEMSREQQDIAGMYPLQAVMSHKWDESGTRLFAVGGPLAFGVQGCYMACFS